MSDNDLRQEIDGVSAWHAKFDELRTAIEDYFRFKDTPDNWGLAKEKKAAERELRRFCRPEKMNVSAIYKRYVD